MNIANVLRIMAICLVFVQMVQADELTPAQLKFRSNIVQFLTEEGFAPSIDEDDNSVNFKKEGELHWISVEDSNPFYIEFHRSGLNSEDANRSVVIEAVNEANRVVRCAKAMLNKSSVSIAIEMYCHSAEEFRYVFYKSLAALEESEKKLKDYYNEHNSESFASNAEISGSLGTLFPIYGFTLGQVTSKDFESKGYIVETISSGAHNCDVKSLTFWDHDKDNVYEQIYMTQSDAMPDQWEERLGLDWRLSYNQWIQLCQKLGFSIKVQKEPVTVSYGGRKTLSAQIIVTSFDGHLSLDLDFNYGNRKGEGYSLNSPNSLYSITIKVK